LDGTAIYGSTGLVAILWAPYFRSEDAASVNVTGVVRASVAIIALDCIVVATRVASATVGCALVVFALYSANTDIDALSIEGNLLSVLAAGIGPGRIGVS
jgi:hypothetical protein